MTLARPMRWIGGGALLVATLFWLSWIDVLPGGWTLRGLVEPHPQREERARLAYEAERLAQFVGERGAPAAGAIFFGGSSTIERFPLAALFDPTKTVARGINDEPCERFLARLSQSLPAEPIGGAVLYMASVDFRRLMASPAEIEARVEKAMIALEEAPRTTGDTLPGLLIGILPEQNMPSGWRERLADTNARLERLCERRGWDFLDTTRPPITLENGDLNPAVATDPWHLNEAGYTELVAWWLEEFPAWRERLGIDW